MRRRRQGLQVSTFPFLAVLLCTMGSLILLLLVIDRRARVVARVKALQAAAQKGGLDEKTEAARRAEWERRARALHEQLVREDREVQGQLVSLHTRENETANHTNSGQSELSELRQRIRAEAAKLTQKGEELTARRAAITAKEKESAVSQEAMSGLTAELMRLERTLAEVKAAHAKQQQVYSLVPYRGKRGDSRKPIYIECAANGLMFHPDGKDLRGFGVTAMDYRKEIVHRLANGERDYLLLLVRPDGISSYYRLIGALQGLKIDYGYEFIDRDWVLDFSGEQPQPWMLAEKAKQEAIDLSPGKSRRVVGVASGTPVATAGPDVPASSGSTSNPSAAQTSPSNNMSGSRDDRAALPSLYPKSDRVADGPGIGLSGTPGGIGVPTPGNKGGSVTFTPGGQATGGLVGGSGSQGLSSGGLADGADRGTIGTPAYGSGQPSNAPPPSIGTGPNQAGQSGADAGGIPPESISGRPLNALPRGAEPGRIQAGQPGSADAGGGPTVNIGVPVATGTPPSPSEGAGGTGQLPAPPPVLPQTETGQAKAQNSGASSGSPGGNGIAGSPASSGGDGDGSGLPATPSPLDKLAGPRKRPIGLTSLRPILFNRNRDWFIKIDCCSDRIVIEATGKLIEPATLAGADPASNPLIENVKAMIKRRQATVAEGDIPYRPLIRFCVHPNGVRAYYLAYPALEALNVPLSRENLEAEEGNKP